MSNYKRTRQYPGRPALLDPELPKYRTIWLQPHSESQVPMQVRVYVNRDGDWVGWRRNDEKRLEITWLKSLWKHVPSPLGVEAYEESDTEETSDETEAELP